MAVLHFRRIERRRTARVALRVDLVVKGESDQGERFETAARTSSVSGHGGLMTLETLVAVGQTLVLTNSNSGQNAECRVVSTKATRDGHTNVAFEFTADKVNFWKMSFPAPGAKPLRRAPQTHPEFVSAAR